MRRPSVQVDANDVSHRSAATPIAGYNETQRVIRKQCAVHVVGELNRAARKLWGDLREGDDCGIAVCTGDPDRKASLLAGLYGLGCAGGDKYIPQQRTRPFTLLFAAVGSEGDFLGNRLKSGYVINGNNARRLARALHEKSG